MQLKFIIIMMLCSYQSICLTQGPKTTAPKPKSEKSPETSKQKKPLSEFLQSSTKALHTTSNYIQSQLQQLNISLQAFIAKLVPSIPKLLQQISKLQRQQKNSDSQNQQIQKILIDMQKDFVTLQTMKAQPEKYSQEQIEKITQDITDKFDRLTNQTKFIKDQPLQQNIANFQATFTKLLSADDTQQAMKSQHEKHKDITSLELKESDAHQNALAKSVDLKKESLSTQKDNVQAKSLEQEQQQLLETSPFKAPKQKSLSLSSEEIASKKQAEEGILQSIERDLTQLQDMLTHPTNFSAEQRAANLGKLRENQSVYDELTKEISDPDIKSKIKEKMDKYQQDIDSLLPILETQKKAAHKDFVVHVKHVKKVELPEDLVNKIQKISQKDLGTDGRATGPLETTREYADEDYIDKAIKRNSDELNKEIDALTRQQADALRQMTENFSESTLNAYDNISQQLTDKETTRANQRTIKNLKEDLAPYSHVINSRGDGNCGYRAIMVSMLVENLHNKKIVAHLKDLIQEKFTTLFTEYDTALISHKEGKYPQDVQTYQKLKTYVLNKLDEINACKDIESIKRLIDHDTTFDYSMIMFERYLTLKEIEVYKGNDSVQAFIAADKDNIVKNIGTWRTELEVTHSYIIAQALNINIRTIAQEIPQNIVSTGNKNTAGDKNTPAVGDAHILFVPGHYKLLVKKHDQPAL